MKCSHTKIRTLATRKYGTRDAPVRFWGYITYRRKKCLNCGEKFGTYEMTHEQIRDWKRS